MMNSETSMNSSIFQIDENITGFRCVWTLNDYMKIKRDLEFKKGVEMEHTLNLRFGKLCKFRVLLYPNGMTTEDETELYFGYFKRDSSDVPQPVSILLKVKILDFDEEPIIPKEFFITSKVNTDGGTWNIVKIDDLKKPTKYLVNNSIIISMIGLVSMKANPNEIVLNDLLHRSVNSVISGLKQLKSQGKYYSDVSITIGDELFDLHKVVLANKSGTFDKMFRENKKAKKHFTVRDLTPDIFRELAHFIYTNSVTHKFHNMLLEVFKASDKYDIPELKILCEKCVLSNISVENAATYFVVAHNHSSSEIKKKCAEVIRKNWDGVKNTEGWNELKESSHMLLLMDVSFSTQ